VGCGSGIALHAARPIIGADGRVALWCASCAVNGPPRREAAAPVAIVEAVEPPEPRRSRFVRAVMPVVGAAIAFVAMMSTAAVTVIEKGPESTTVANVADDVIREAVAVRVLELGAQQDEVVVEPEIRTTTTETLDQIELDPLEDDRPSLRDWVHPVTGTDEKVPARSTRRFGAHREGVSDPTKCGSGHCGLDLAGPRGRPVVAVAWGTVVRVEHAARGRDGRSGRYVRIEHPEGVFTSYMHLDAIEADLRVGDEVVAGQVIGTLGKTGIYHGEQHLHFGLEIEIDGALRYVDATPFLERAEVVPVPTDELHLLPEERSNW
jgi:murein DD-endopeptidase MepM/ murein hydrolase activator NlpD